MRASMCFGVRAKVIGPAFPLRALKCVCRRALTVLHLGALDDAALLILNQALDGAACNCLDRVDGVCARVAKQVAHARLGDAGGVRIKERGIHGGCFEAFDYAHGLAAVGHILESATCRCCGGGNSSKIRRKHVCHTLCMHAITCTSKLYTCKQRQRIIFPGGRVALSAPGGQSVADPSTKHSTH
jgi:hypothetical protein